MDRFFPLGWQNKLGYSGTPIDLHIHFLVIHRKLRVFGTILADIAILEKNDFAMMHPKDRSEICTRILCY